MKKVCLLLLIFIVFSCKSAPKNKIADDPGLSQLELTKENDQAGAAAEFSDEMSADEMSADEPPVNETPLDEPSAAETSSADKDARVQDDITDGSVISENLETKTDDLQADAQNKEQKPAAETVDEKKETPEGKNASAKEDKPPVLPANPVQPPPAVAKTEPSSAKTPAAEKSAAEAQAAEKPAEEKQEAPSESEEPQAPPPPRYQPWIAPPPAVTAVKDDAPVPNRQTLVPPKEDNVFSRIVRAAVGQLVDIPFRGTNWSYLEDMVSRRGIAYMSRRVDSEGMTFTFRAEETGIYALRFYRRDYIRDYILYDYVQVIVDEPPKKNGTELVNPSVDRGKVTAEPRWPSAFEEAEMLRSGARSALAAEPVPNNKNGSGSSSPTTSANRDSTPAQASSAVPPQGASPNRETSVQGTFPSPQVAVPQVVTPQAAGTSATATEKQSADGTLTTETPPAEKKEKLPPEEILKKAQESFNGGKTPEAIALLDQYEEQYPGGNDELYWLYGQFYESNTPSRNILLSLDYYRRLVNEYPQSGRYNDARKRIAYLERFYVNIQ